MKSLFFELLLNSCSHDTALHMMHDSSPSDIGLCGVCSSRSPCLSARALSSCARWPYSSCGPYTTPVINSSPHSTLHSFFLSHILFSANVAFLCVLAYSKPSTCFHLQPPYPSPLQTQMRSAACFPI